MRVSFKLNQRIQELDRRIQGLERGGLRRSRESKPKAEIRITQHGRAHQP